MDPEHVPAENYPSLRHGQEAADAVQPELVTLSAPQAHASHAVQELLTNRDRRPFQSRPNGLQNNE